MLVRAVRGATRLDEDTPDHVRERVAELLAEVVRVNGLAADDVVSVVFTCTADLVSASPASALEAAGLADVPALCAREAEVAGGAPRTVRMLAHVAAHLTGGEASAVYLHGAAG